jgi:uncharacterized damage-inducible protein DinB
MIDQLIETWQINNRVDLYLLNAIKEEYLIDLPASKGRNVGEQFGHIHNVRLMWIKEGDSTLLKGLDKIEREKPITKKLIKDCFLKSNEAIVKMLSTSLAEGKLRGFKPHPVAFLGYLLAHEAHHRGQIMISLKENGHLSDKSLGFALWQWGTR